MPEWEIGEEVTELGQTWYPCSGEIVQEDRSSYLQPGPKSASILLEDAHLSPRGPICSLGLVYFLARVTCLHSAQFPLPEIILG